MMTREEMVSGEPDRSSRQTWSRRAWVSVPPPLLCQRRWFVCASRRGCA